MYKHFLKEHRYILMIGFVLSIPLYICSGTDGIQNTLLFLTGIILLAYTAETNALRHETTNQNELSSKLIKNELLPILTFNGTTIMQGESLQMAIRNIGKGPAKNITVKIEGNSFVIKDTLFQESNLNIGMPDDISVRNALINLISESERDHISASLHFYDYYERCISINGIIFRKDPNDQNTRYVLEENTWKYEGLPE